MDHDNSIRTIRGDIVDEVIAEFVRKALTIEALGCIRIDEDETGIAVHIGRCRAFRIEIPTQDAAVTRDTLLKCLKGTNDIRRRAASRTTAGDECAVESVPAKVHLVATAIPRRVLPGRCTNCGVVPVDAQEPGGIGEWQGLVGVFYQDDSRGSDLTDQVGVVCLYVDGVMFVCVGVDTW